MLKYSNSVYSVRFKAIYFGWNGVLARGWLTPRWHGLKSKIASNWISITCNFMGCPEQESNLHASRHSHLKRARLPFRHLGFSPESKPRCTTPSIAADSLQGAYNTTSHTAAWAEVSMTWGFCATKLILFSPLYKFFMLFFYHTPLSFIFLSVD